jgi:hypothetical protein
MRRGMPEAWVFSVRRKGGGVFGVCREGINLYIQARVRRDLPEIIVGKTGLGMQCMPGVEIFWCSG